MRNFEILCSNNSDLNQFLLRSYTTSVHFSEFLHIIGLSGLTEMSHDVLNRLSQSHFEFDNTKRISILTSHCINLSPPLDYWSLAIQTLCDNLLVNQLTKYDFSTTHLHCCVILADIYVKLEWVLLQEVDIKLINLIDERELSLIVGSDSFAHLRCLSAMVIEITSDDSDELLLHVSRCHVHVRQRCNWIRIKLGILHFEVQNVLIMLYFTFLCHSWKFAS